ncbi:MAG: hypothetical protein NVS2B16_32550 [Chloroflexota bacterium]
MTYLVDTDYVADYLGGMSWARALLQAHDAEGLSISLMTLGEIYEGIEYGRDPQRAEQVFQTFLTGVTVLPFNRVIMRRFAHIRGELRRQGQLIGDPDILIAATALHHDLILLTRNRRHFDRIPGLRLLPAQEEGGTG